MRTGDSLDRIETAINSGNFTPVVGVLYYDGAEWQAIADADLWEVQHNESVYSSSCVVKINNYAGTYNSLDIRDKKVIIAWGAVTPSGSETASTATLWGTGQRLTSSEDGTWYFLYAEGAWDRLRRWVCDDNYRYNQDDATLQNFDISEIINHIAEKAGTDLGSDIGTLDGKVDSWEPIGDTIKGQSGLDIIKGMLGLTKCVLVPRGDDLSLKYPAAGDAVDRTYTSDSTHYFDISAAQSILFRPMKVIITDLDGNTGSYADANWVSTMGTMDITVRAGVTTSNADCEWLATAIVERAAAQSDTGIVVCPMDCAIEIHDKVTITDNRDGTGATGRVGSIYRHFVADTGIYEIEIRLGGYQRQMASDLNSMVMDVVSFGQVDGANIIPNSIFPIALFKTAQDYKLNITFTPTNADTVVWTAGTINFIDGSSEGINAGTKSSISGDVYIYFDLAQKTGGSLDLQNTTTLTDTLGERKGRVAFVKNASSGAGSAICLVPSGKDSYLNADFITCGVLSAISGNIGTITAGFISGINITGSTISGGVITGGSVVASIFSGGTISGCYISGGTIVAGAGKIELKPTGGYLDAGAGDQGGLYFMWNGTQYGQIKTYGVNQAGIEILATGSRGLYLHGDNAIEVFSAALAHLKGSAAKVEATSGDVNIEATGNVDITATKVDLHSGTTAFHPRHIRQAARPGAGDLATGELAVWEDSDATDCDLLYKDEDDDLYYIDFSAA